MVIDVHTHISKHVGDKAGTFKQNLNLLLKEMKRSGTDHALVLPMFKKANQCAPVVSEVLELIKEIKNLDAVGTIDIMGYKKRDLEELEEWLRKKMILGIKLYPGYQHFYPSDKICNPIYKLCLKYDVPIIFHSGDTYTACNPQAKVQYSHPLPIDSVATDFPDLKIIIAHLGNPWTTDCAEVLYKNKNVYADISGLVTNDKALFSTYGQLMKRKIQDLIAYSSPSKLLFGTDWPLATMKSYLKFARSLDLSKKDLDCIFSKNALELFQIKI